MNVAAKIAWAVSRVRRAGWAITPGTWKALSAWSRPGRCCPMGAVSILAGGDHDDSHADAAARSLGVSHKWVLAFANGFDGYDLGVSGRGLKLAYRLGREWRIRMCEGLS